MSADAGHVQALVAALQKADAAGDTQGARVIAGAIRRAQGLPAVNVVDATKTDPSVADPSAAGLDVHPFGLQALPAIHLSPGIGRFMAGAGQSVADTGRGIRQLYESRFGDAAGRASAQAAVDNARARDTALDKTGAGMAGQLAGYAAQYALPEAGAAKLASLIPGLAKYAGTLGSAYAGALAGRLMPTATGESRGLNEGVGAIAGPVGRGLGNVASSALRVPVGATTRLVSGVADKAKELTDRAAYALSQRYGVPLRFPQLEMNRGMPGYIADLAADMPFSGQEHRSIEQQLAFDQALGRTIGANSMDPHDYLTKDIFERQHDLNGKAIGDIAARHTLDVNPLNGSQFVARLTAIGQRAAASAPKEIRSAVTDRINQLLEKVDPETNTMPGQTWREQNTALGRQWRDAGNNGDLRYYIGKIEDVMHDAMQDELANTPDEQAAFNVARQRYRNGKTLEPLVMKSNDTGIRPALLKNRTIAAKNTEGPLWDLGVLGQGPLKKIVPNSGTAQRLIAAETARGVAGMGLGALGYEAGKRYGGEDRGLEIAAPFIAAPFYSRAINNPLLLKYAMTEAPRVVQPIVRAALSGSAGAGAAAADQLFGQAPGKASGGKVETTMHEFKTGKLHSGSKRGPVVTSRRQAIAIALNQARRAS